MRRGRDFVELSGEEAVDVRVSVALGVLGLDFDSVFAAGGFEQVGCSAFHQMEVDRDRVVFALARCGRDQGLFELVESVFVE